MYRTLSEETRAAYRRGYVKCIISIKNLLKQGNYQLSICLRERELIFEFGNHVDISKNPRI